MSGSLIINARHRLAWYQRLLSDASTALMWGAWLWLWVPVLRAIAELGMRSSPVLVKLVTNGTGGDLPSSVMALVGTSGTLLVWKGLPARKALADGEALSLRDYARHFALSESSLLAGRRAAVCVVHHDDDGRIVRLECREPVATPAPAERRAPAVVESLEPATCGAALACEPVARGQAVAA
ncbi:poly-beta-1,6-N-acetyl-D-glucosamine biosynthesis protein PgaD [Anaeromyxobacter sp. Red801]|uniref:poly-beta-1,6-N-acetyl-D-glucosamine biosynthesis protein PgaD n=1 Tax=Anaeromyxobacter sp. Red801 TaxID=3411632 RepID=UPI003BA2F863